MYQVVWPKVRQIACRSTLSGDDRLYQTCLICKQVRMLAVMALMNCQMQRSLSPTQKSHLLARSHRYVQRGATSLGCVSRLYHWTCRLQVLFLKHAEELTQTTLQAMAKSGLTVLQSTVLCNRWQAAKVRFALMSALTPRRPPVIRHMVCLMSPLYHMFSRPGTCRRA